MADVKWIKITTDIFDDEKILLIESLPDSYAIITCWFKLLCLAGKQNNSGVFMMGRVAYTDKMLATIFRMKESTVTLALQTFEQFGMVEIVDGVITIPNWGKHQNLDQLESKKEYMRGYMKEYREKQRRLLGNSKLCENGLPLDEWDAVLDYFGRECAYCGAKDGLEQEHIVPVNEGGKYEIGNIVPSCRRCNASKGAKHAEVWYAKSESFNPDRLKKLIEYRCKTNVSDLRKTNVSSLDKEGEEDQEERLDIKRGGEIPPAPTPQEIVNLYNEICKSFPAVKTVSEARKKAIKARLNTYQPEDFKALFEAAEASSFLKGKNPRNWSANFDWLIKDANMAKVLEGQYKDKGASSGESSFDVNDFFNASAGRAYGRAALEREVAAKMGTGTEGKRTIDNDEELRRRADELRQKLS